MTQSPRPDELWRKAHDEFPDDPAAASIRYVALMREHGHLRPTLPGESRNLPCGWPDPPPSESKTSVRFVGGPWDGQEADVDRVTAPVFAVGHQVGNHYWLDTKGRDIPTFYWDGTPWETKADNE